MRKNKLLPYILKIVIVPASLVGCAFLAHAILSDRYSPLYGLLLLSALVVDLASLPRWRLLQNLLIGAYSLLLAFAAVEAVSLILSPEPATSLTQKPGDLFGDHPVLGWGPTHAEVVHAIKTATQTKNVVYDVHYTIDANNLRKTVSAEAGSTVAFFGDSWPYGDGVNDAETFPQVFADLNARKLRVLNFGFPGYGPQQFLRTVETGFEDQLLGPQLKLIVFTMFAFQAERPACKAAYVLRAPRYVLDENGNVQFAGYCAQGLRRALLEFFMHSAFFQRYLEPRVAIIHKQDMELFIAITLRAARLAQAKYNVPVMIIYDRVAEDYLAPSGYTNDEIIAKFRDAGLDILDMDISKEVPPDTVVSLPNDGHPTAAAQRARAIIFKRYLDEHMPSLTAAAIVP